MRSSGILFIALSFVAAPDLPAQDALPAEAINPNAGFVPIVRAADEQADQHSKRIASLQQKLLEIEATVDFVDAPLGEVAAFLTEAWGVPVRLDERSLADVGLSGDTPVTFQAAQIPAYGVLGHMLRQLDLTWLVRPGGVLITTPERAEENLQTTFYPVTDLLEGPPYDFDSLIELVTTVIEPESWNEGKPRVGVYQNGIVLPQTPYVHALIESLLAELRRVKQLPRDRYPTTSTLVGPLAQKPQGLLDKAQTTSIALALTDAPLTDVVNALSMQAEVPILLDRWALEDAGMALDEPVSLDIQNDTLAETLDQIALNNGLAWTAHAGMLVLTTPEEAETYRHVRVYPVADLLWRGLDVTDPGIRRLLKPELRLSGPQIPTWQQRQVTATWQLPALPDGDGLVEAITVGVEAESWEELGGPGSLMVFEDADALVVSQTREVHAKLADLLAQIRRSQEPLDPHRLKKAIDEYANEVLTVPYPLPRDADGRPLLDDKDLGLIAQRLTTLVDEASWNEPRHFLDVTSTGLIARNRRQVLQKVEQFLSDTGYFNSPEDSLDNTKGIFSEKAQGYGGGAIMSGGMF